MVLLLLNYLYNDKEMAIAKQLAEQVQGVLQSSSGTVFLHLPLNYMMVRQYDQVLFSRQTSRETGDKDFKLLTDEWSEAVNGFRYRVTSTDQLPENEDAGYWYFAGPADLQLLIRTRKPGDRIRLAGMDQPKKVARLMIDEKLPAPLRGGWPVITDGNNEILLVPGVRPSAHVSRTKRHSDNWVLIEQHV